MFSNERVLNIFKPEGLTPLGALNLLKQKHPELALKKLSYAGRLDPLASGVMLVLVGEETKNKDQFLKLNKVYEAKILFGFSTDTGDVLGLIKETSKQDVDLEKIEITLMSHQGCFTQDYPKYSSPIIAGRKSFTKEVEVFELKLLETAEISGEQLLGEIENKVKKVKGDFRQEKTLKNWQKSLKGSNDRQFKLVKIKACVSSGTYIRQLAEKIGQDLGAPALAYEIKRTAVDSYKLIDSIALE